MESDRGTDAPHSSRCTECSAPLASDQRYCISCGARRGELPAEFAALIATTFEQGPGDGREGLPPAADPDPDPDPGSEEAESSRPPWLPPPRATAFAVLCMLGFGVMAGSLVKPNPASLAHTLLVAVPPASAPAATGASAPASGDVGGGGGGSGGGGGTETITRIIKTVAPPAQQQAPAQSFAPPVPADGGGGGAGGGGGGDGG